MEKGCIDHVKLMSLMIFEVIILKYEHKISSEYKPPYISPPQNARLRMQALALNIEVFYFC